MSNKPIKTSVFDEKVYKVDWEDHHSPALLDLFNSVDHMYKQVLADFERVLVVHCNAGKGRTGTTIACFLIYSGLCQNFMQALTFYGHQRFENGRGVTQPSQQRFVQYFSMANQRVIKSPSIKKLVAVDVKYPPSGLGDDAEARIEIYDGKMTEEKKFKLIYTDNQYNS